MAKQIGRNTNTADIATLGIAIALNATTSTTIVAAADDRIGFYLTNIGPQDIWLKFQAASVDNIKKGIKLTKDAVYEMPTDNIYTGEISAIGALGNPAVTPVEY